MPYGNADTLTDRHTRPADVSTGYKVPRKDLYLGPGEYADPIGKASALACHLHDAAKLVDRLETANARLAAALINAGGEWPEKDGVGDDPETPGQLGRLHAIIDALDELIGRTEGLADRVQDLIG